MYVVYIVGLVVLAVAILHKPPVSTLRLVVAMVLIMASGVMALLRFGLEGAAFIWPATSFAVAGYLALAVLLGRPERKRATHC